MTIKRTDSGWLVDIQPGGRGSKRYRKTFATKLEAQRWDRYMRAQVDRAPDWQPPERDRRRLSELVRIWYDGHGNQLRDGRRRRDALLRCVQAMGDPVMLTAQTFSQYRVQRLAAGVSANTVNHEHAYLRAMFSELERLGEWLHPNPLAKIRRLRMTERELSFLSRSQVQALLAELGRGRNQDALQVARVCLATGARWSEVETLRAEQISPGLITFSNTKNGRSRAVPVSPALAEQLGQRRPSGRLFSRCYDAFRHAIGRAGIDLPAGQLTHVLRHTFASHFIQQGGNILTLQRILGHASLTMTMRYAHLAPGHLDEARRLNPLMSLTDG